MQSKRRSKGPVIVDRNRVSSFSQSSIRIGNTTSGIDVLMQKLRDPLHSRKFIGASMTVGDHLKGLTWNQLLRDPEIINILHGHNVVLNELLKISIANAGVQIFNIVGRFVPSRIDGEDVGDAIQKLKKAINNKEKFRHIVRIISVSMFWIFINTLRFVIQKLIEKIFKYTK